MLRTIHIKSTVPIIQILYTKLPPPRRNTAHEVAEEEEKEASVSKTDSVRTGSMTPASHPFAVQIFKSKY
jgi:hypothetical protein